MTIIIVARPTHQQKPKLGGAVNIFSRYGYLSISMRVVPRNDSDTWIFREPTLEIVRSPTTQPATPKSRKQAVIFDGDFHMEFCDNVRQLLQVSKLFKIFVKIFLQPDYFVPWTERQLQCFEILRIEKLVFIFLMKNL